MSFDILMLDESFLMKYLIKKEMQIELKGGKSFRFVSTKYEKSVDKI